MKTGVDTALSDMGYGKALGWILATIFFILTGCTVGPDHVRPELDLPVQWQPESGSEEKLLDQWWTLYWDETLNRLIDKALEHNHDLAIAIARVDEARAYLGIARSAQLPSIGIDGGASRGETPPGSGVKNAYSLDVAVAFELDFWGKYRRATEAAKAELLATEAAYRTVRLTLTTETAKAYFALLSVDRQLKTSSETLETRKKAEKLYHDRFTEGYTGELDYLQSQVETTTALAMVQNLEIAQVQAENALAVLIGQSPREMVEEKLDKPVAVEEISVPEFIPAGIPSALIERRPDIIEAEELLHAATADIGVAKAAFLPSFSLTGLLGWATPQFSSFINSDNRRWSLGGGLFQPIFQGGRLDAQLEAANARQKQAYSFYHRTVNNAFREVLDALVANRIRRDRLVTIQTQVKTLHKTVELANLRYEEGYSNFLDVLDAQRALFNSQIELAQAYQAQLDAVATLCQALGGGWSKSKANTM